MKNADLIWNASLDELKQGYIENEQELICLCCGTKVEKGIIYPEDGILYEAGRYIRVHIEKAHDSVFDYLIRLDKSVTGLSDTQKNLLELFYRGKSDSEVQKELGIGSASTIRNHRFILKEKERQAKLFLAVMELLKAQLNLQQSGDKDDRSVTEEEKVIKKYFPAGPEGPLKSFSMKQKHKLIVLNEIAKRFESERIYTEKEINQVLETVYGDYVTIRRYLIEYGFLDRKSDGSEYWLKKREKESEKTPEKREEETHMDRKKELKEQAKDIKTVAGVYQIRNTQNHKVFIDSTQNLKTMNGKQFQLEMGGHPNKNLQKEWNEFGKDAFVFEVLETLEKKDGVYFDEKEALKKLEEKWLDKLQPFGERGYHK